MRSLRRVARAVFSTVLNTPAAVAEVSSSDRCDAEVAAAQTELSFAATTAAIEDIEYLAAALEDLRNELYAAVLSIDGEASTNPGGPAVDERAAPALRIVPARPIQKLKT